MPILGTIASSLLKSFTDTFNRTTSGSLGTSSGGGLWSAIKGVWFANGTVGTSNDSASTYPIAGYNLGLSSVTLNLDTPSASSSAGGAGAAFWITDASNWWGMFPFVATNTSYSQVCNAWTTSTAQYTCNAYGTAYYQECGSTNTNYSSVCNGYTTTYSQVCTGYTTNYFQVCTGYTTTYTQQCEGYSTTYSSVCNSWFSQYDGFRGFYYQGCNGWYQSSSTVCAAWSGVPTSSCSSWGQGSSSTCSSWGASPSTSCSSWTFQVSYSCGSWFQGSAVVCTSSFGPFYTQACTNYFQQTNTSPGAITLRLIKSVANTVTTVVDQALTQAPASIQVITSGGVITGKAFTAAGQGGTQIGTNLSTTQTAGGTTHGIILAPGGYGQATTVDNITIKL